jgi:hypothetical protein
MIGGHSFEGHWRKIRNLLVMDLSKRGKGDGA